MEESREFEDKNIVEYTMSVRKMNLIGLLFIFPITAVILIPFVMIWDFETFYVGEKVFFNYFIYILIGGICVHELLHGLTWAMFTKNGMKSIKFGINWKGLAPYCHCKEPLKVIHYKIGGAMPLIIMGLIPSIIGLVFGNGAILSFGIFFTWAAGGDIISLYMLRKFDNNIYVSDHPDKMGFIYEIERSS